MKFYECKAKYLKLQEDGKEKYVTEIYVFSATSFSEAEEKLKNEMDSFSSGEYDIVAIKIDNNCFVITGGAIKFHHLNKDRPHTQKEMQKINRCRDYLKDNGVFDADSFYEFLNEQK